MTDKKDERTDNKGEFKPTSLENEGRRKAVKTIVGTVTAVTAYHVLPVKWDSPIIEQVFLPAHAATSGSVPLYFIGDVPGGGPLCVSIIGSTATFYAFDQDIAGKYITGTGPVSAASITGNRNQNGTTEPDGTAVTVSGISNLGAGGGTVTLAGSNNSGPQGSAQVNLTPKSDSCI